MKPVHIALLAAAGVGGYLLLSGKKKKARTLGTHGDMNFASTLGFYKKELPPVEDVPLRYQVTMKYVPGTLSAQEMNAALEEFKAARQKYGAAYINEAAAVKFEQDQQPESFSLRFATPADAIGNNGEWVTFE